MKHIRNLLMSLILVSLAFSCSIKPTETSQCKKPVFSPEPGTQTLPVDITITSPTPDAEIYYSLDSSHPATLYTAPITISVNTTIRAKASRAGYDDSPVVLATYIIQSAQTTATPVISPPAGSYENGLLVTITCPTSGAIIRYTTNGLAPDSNSPIYQNPIYINATTVIKAKAFYPGWNESQLAESIFSFDTPTDNMVYIGPATFNMGRTTGTGESNELPVHSVTLSPYYIGRYEVTQAEWISVMGYNPSAFIGDLNRPVDNISWFSAVVYCNKRSMAEGFTPVYSLSGSTNPDDWGIIPTWNDLSWRNITCDWTGNGYRLPTEAEWECAAKGATNNPNYMFSGSSFSDLVAWNDQNSGGTTHPVGQKIPNLLGLYDMSGNVYEFCWDFFEDTYYNTSPMVNPTGPVTGVYRVMRGGCWEWEVDYCRVSSRGYVSDYSIGDWKGIRVVRSAQ